MRTNYYLTTQRRCIFKTVGRKGQVLIVSITNNVMDDGIENFPLFPIHYFYYPFPYELFEYLFQFFLAKFTLIHPSLHSLDFIIEFRANCSVFPFGNGVSFSQKFN